MHVVLVPGLGLTERAWAPTIRHLPPGTASVLRLPGYGLPARRGTDLRPSALAAVVVDHLARRGHAQVVLVGHSASCQIVAEAARRDNGVAGLVLVGPTTDPRARTWHGLVGRWLATARHESPRLVPPLLPQYLGTGLVSMGRAMQAARRHDIRGSLGRVDVPIAVVRGPDDRISPSSWITGLAPWSATTGEGAHMIPMTDPVEVALVIRRLVEATNQPRRG